MGILRACSFFLSVESKSSRMLAIITPAILSASMLLSSAGIPNASPTRNTRLNIVKLIKCVEIS